MVWGTGFGEGLGILWWSRPRDQCWESGRGAEVTVGLSGPACPFRLAGSLAQSPGGAGCAFFFVFLAPTKASSDQHTSESSCTLEIRDVTEPFTAWPLKKPFQTCKGICTKPLWFGGSRARAVEVNSGVGVSPGFPPVSRSEFFFNELMAFTIA